MRPFVLAFGVIVIASTQAIASDLNVDLGKSTPPTGNKLNGPVRIRLLRANKLLNTYHIAIDNQNWQSPPSVTISTLQGIIPSFSTTGLTPPPAGTTVNRSLARPSVENTQGTALSADDKGVAWILEAQDLVTQAQQASDALNQAVALAQGLYQRSSNDLSVSRDTFVNDIHSSLSDPNLVGYSSSRWPSPASIDQVEAGLTAAKQAGGLSAAVASRLDDAIAALDKVGAGSVLSTNFSSAFGALNAAVNTMRSIAPTSCKFADDPSRVAGDPVCDSLQISEDAQCHSVFGSNDAKITLVVTQSVVFPGSSSAQSQGSTQNVDLGTMTCSPPVTFSAGVAFSTIREQEFGIAAVPNSTGGTTNEFVLTSNSTFKPIPMGFVHARLWESTEGKYGLHFTFGIGANIRGQNSGGSDAEYLLGGSLSLWHIAYITSGVHLGSKVTLANGYTVGGAVPSSVTQPPLQTGRAAGFGFGISFGTSPK